jgi:serine/threonine protein kinase
VDCTFVINGDEAQRAAPVTHGVFTPPEQVSGRPIYASDIYALGASVFYGITGTDIPSLLERSRDPDCLGSLPDGGHPSVDFPEFLAEMLSLEGSERPSHDWTSASSAVPCFTGALLLKNPRGVLTIDMFSDMVDVLEPAVAVERLEEEARQARRQLASYHEKTRERAQHLVKLLELMLGALREGLA